MKNRLSILIFVLVLLLFHGLNNYYILIKSRYFPMSDSMSYFQQLNEICQSLKEAKLNLKLPYKIYIDLVTSDYADRPHPQLFLYAAAPFFLYRADKDIAVMANLIYFAILLFATYGIGKRLYSSEVGILSAFLVSMFPTVFGLSRVFLLDFSLTAMVALTFYLFTVNRFDRLMFSFLVGLIIGLGLLTKLSYAIFLIPMLLYFVFQQKNKRDSKSIRGFCFSILVALLISGRFYVPLESKINFFRYWIGFQERGDLYFYLQSLLSRQLLLVFFSLFFISLVFCLRDKKYYLPIMTIIPLIFFSVCPSRADRFILPIFSFIAVMIVGFIWSLPRFRKAFIVILILFSFLQYFTISYKPYIPTKYLIPGITSPKMSTSTYGFTDYVDLTTIIDEGDWKSPAEELIKIISENRKKIEIDSKIHLGLYLHGGNYSKFSEVINYWTIVKKLPLEIHIPLYDREISYGYPKDETFNDPVAHFDFVILQENFPENKISENNLCNRINNFRRNYIDKYDFIRTSILPDNCSYSIYKRKSYVKEQNI